MTPDLEATLRAALARATAGDWLAGPADMFGDHNIILAESEDRRAVAAVVSNMRPEDEVEANAAFIALAKNHMGDLLDTLSALRAQVEARDTVLHAWLAYDQLLRSYSGPLTVLGAGDFEVADRTYDDCVATTRATLAESGHAE